MYLIQLAKHGGQTLNIFKHVDEYSGHNNFFDLLYIGRILFILHGEAFPAIEVSSWLPAPSFCLLAHALCRLRYVCYYTRNLMHGIRY